MVDTKRNICKGIRQLGGDNTRAYNVLSLISDFLNGLYKNNIVVIYY